MTLQELRALLAPSTDATTDIAAIIQKLMASQSAVDLTDYRKQFGPATHKTMDKVQRKDKTIKKPTGKTDDKGNEILESAIVPVNRLAFPLQKLIVERAVSFLFGNPVKIKCEAKSDPEKKVLAALTRILYDNKTDSFNRRIARELFRSTQVAECWFPVTVETHNDYGFSTTYKLRSTAFNPWDGNELYPLFDETGDLIAFSRAYTLKDDQSREVGYFETYTADRKRVWKKENGTWVGSVDEENIIGKIPVVYGTQEQVEWEDVQWSIERLEYLLSNFADVNDYHAAPKIFVNGKIEGFGQKGEPGQILQGSKDTKAEYLSWDHAPESVKLEIETLLRFIFTFTQTPDISFDSVKGLREISGEALKMLFLDAHLKVQNKREIFDEYLQRRISIIKAFLAKFNTSLKDVASTLTIEAEVQPFIINDLKAMIDNLVTANGGKPIISQKTALALSGLVNDVDAEYKLLLDEQEAERATSITEPTI